MSELSLSLQIHNPSKFKVFLERVHVREIDPSDICSNLALLYSTFPELAGDKGAIGESDFYGKCQAWRDDPGWWKKFISEVNS